HGSSACLSTFSRANLDGQRRGLASGCLLHQLKVNPMGTMQYAAEREATLFEHLAELQQAYGFRQFTARNYRELSAWLMPLTLSTNAGPALVGALIEEMRDRKIFIPGITTVERLGWEVRRRAQRQV